MPGRSPITRALLKALSPAGSRARVLILTFHSVPAETDALTPDVATAERFEQQMQWLRSCCEIMDLTDVATLLPAGRLPERVAVVTFDDGYANNYQIAADILERLSIPATFFITSGAIESGIMWNDLVIEGIRRGDGSVDLDDIGVGRFVLSDLASRRQSIKSIIGELKYRRLDDRLEQARLVYERCSGGEPVPRLMMERDEVKALDRRGFTLGGHTVNHPILAELDDESARQEISGCHQWLEALTGKAPACFAYPNGRPSTDFLPEHEAMVRDAGFDVAVSTQWGAATSQSPIYALPRFAPWETSASAYRRRLLKTLVRSYV